MTKDEFIEALEGAPGNAIIYVFNDHLGGLSSDLTVETHLSANNPYTDIYHDLPPPLVVINTTEKS